MTGAPETLQRDAEEIDYLCRAANRYFERQIDGARRRSGATAASARSSTTARATRPAITRDYGCGSTPGRAGRRCSRCSAARSRLIARLAEHALAKLAPWFPAWARRGPPAQPLPGGDLAA